MLGDATPLRLCGSSTGNRAAFVDAARTLGTALARRNIGLVYGGHSTGVMGALADAVLSAGGTVIGIILGASIPPRSAHPGLSELRVVSSMHERKEMMESLADGFLALPGGFGTFEELFEMLTWLQLGIHLQAGRPARRRRLLARPAPAGRRRRGQRLHRARAGRDAARGYGCRFVARPTRRLEGARAADHLADAG